MKRMLVAAVFALAATQGSAMDSLSSFGWEKRVVLVFGDAADRKLGQQIEKLVSRTDELRERDMVVIRVVGDDAQAVYGQSPPLDADRLREEANIAAAGFQIVLVGKDGGVKLRSGEIVQDVALFDLIDRMPMRRAEKR